MIEKFERLIAIFLGQNRIDIQSRVLRLVLAGSLLTFAAMGLLSLTGIVTTWRILDSRGQQLGASAADYTEKFAERQAKYNLSKDNQVRAQLIGNYLTDVRLDVLMLSREMTQILSTPERYRPRILPNALETIVLSRTPYVHYSPELARRGVTEELRREIELTSNIADVLETIIEYNPCTFVGSKNGYVLKADVMPANTMITSLSKEPARSTYDARERAWYKLGASVEDPAFTDVYIAAMTGEPCVSCVMPYYDGDGNFAGVVGLDCNTTKIYEQIRESAIGGGGFCFIMSAKGAVIYSTQLDGDFVTGANLFDENGGVGVKAIGRLMQAGVKGVTEIESRGRRYYVAYAPMEAAGWSLATVLDKSEVTEPAMIARGNILDRIDGFKNNFGRLFLFLLGVALVLMLGVMYGLFRVSVKLSNRFVKPIQELSDGVRDIASGDFDKKLDVKTGDELEHLATCFNAMTEELKMYMKNVSKVAADRERIETELNVATDIQTSFLPRDFDFDRTDFELYATMHAAKEVGGDFYDFYLLDHNHLMVTIADVSGKGVPAALFMMVSKTILKNFAMTGAGADDVGTLVARANRQLCEGNDAMMFVTAFVALIDLKTGRMTYVNGGHNPPLVYRASEDRFEYLTGSARNYALGLMDDAEFEQETIDLSRGDVIYLYTDGVTEALNEAEELFGDDRLEQALNRLKARQMSVEEILAAVRSALDEYVGAAQQSDDITMLGFRLK